MSRVNEAFSPLGRGAQKGYGATSTPGGLEPTTPQGPTIPGAVPYSARAPTRDADPIKPSTKLQEDPSYHQPYSRDIHHGEHMFPGVKGHETEEFEKVEGYASPDDVSPEVRNWICMLNFYIGLCFFLWKLPFFLNIFFRISTFIPIDYLI